MATDQERIVGMHPMPPDPLGVWLSCIDFPASINKKHRVLVENAGTRVQAEDMIAKWVFNHLVSVFMLNRLREKRAIMSQYDFEQLLSDYSLLPTLDNTIKGEVTEVILIEYLKKTTGCSPIIHRIHFNPNTDQAMKGDDCLLFDPVDMKNRVIYGESKFRGVPNKNVVEEIVNNLQSNKHLPVSLPFVANILDAQGHKELAMEVMDVLELIKKGHTPVHNVGFLLSQKSSTPSQNTEQVVESHLYTTNPDLVFVSLGIDNPETLITNVMTKVAYMLKHV